VQGKQARVKNADLRHPSCTVVMQKRKSTSPVLNVLTFASHSKTIQCFFHPTRSPRVGGKSEIYIKLNNKVQYSSKIFCSLS